MNIRDLNKNLMYKDSVDIYRYTKESNLDGSTTQKLKDVPELQSIPCMLDIKTADDPDPDGDANSLKVVYTLFSDNEILFKKGDYLKVSKRGVIYKLIAGLPIIYDYHQEIPLILKEWA